MMNENEYVPIPPPPILDGFEYIFEDGVKLTIHQIKPGGANYRVHYYVTNPNALPKKLVLPLQDFLDRFGHLIRARGIVI